MKQRLFLHSDASGVKLGVALPVQSVIPGRVFVSQYMLTEGP